MTLCNEMVNVLENNIVGDRGETILLGDLNINMDDPVDPDTITFNDVLGQSGFNKPCTFWNTHI